jgi:hypothetical protein
VKIVGDRIRIAQVGVPSIRPSTNVIAVSPIAKLPFD